MIGIDNVPEKVADNVCYVCEKTKEYIKSLGDTAPGNKIQVFLTWIIYCF